MEENNTIKVFDENGNEVVCDVLLTFDSEETKKSYIVYTDNTIDESGKIRVYAAIYNPQDEKMKLEDIKTEKEWKIIDVTLQTIQEELSKASNNE